MASPDEAGWLKEAFTVLGLGITGLFGYLTAKVTNHQRELSTKPETPAPVPVHDDGEPIMLTMLSAAMEEQRVQIKELVGWRGKAEKRMDELESRLVSTTMSLRAAVAVIERLIMTWGGSKPYITQDILDMLPENVVKHWAEPDVPRSS